MARRPPISSETRYKVVSRIEAHREMRSDPAATTDRKDINLDQKPFQLKVFSCPNFHGYNFIKKNVHTTNVEFIYQQGSSVVEDKMAIGTPLSSERNKAVSSIEAHQEVTSYPDASTDRKDINLDQKSFQLKVFSCTNFHDYNILKKYYTAHLKFILFQCSSLKEDKMARGTPIHSETRSTVDPSIEAHQEITCYPAASTDRKDNYLDQKLYQLKVCLCPNFHGYNFIKIVNTAHLKFIF